MELSRLIYLRLPYHLSFDYYMKRRNEIFNNIGAFNINKRKPRRSTRRIREYYTKRKFCRKFLASAIVINIKDQRFYAKVSFLKYCEFGLLDTGANISCIGSELAAHDCSRLKNFIKCRSFVKTADGKSQSVTGWLTVEVEFKGQRRLINLFIIPSITQRLILNVLT